MNVRDGMSKVILSVGPSHTLREAARLMSAQRVGAAVVTDPEHSGIGILTERDVLDSLGAGQDPDIELVSDHRTADVVFAAPEWTLEQAAATMAAGGFRHLVVVESGEVAGLLSMRDIVRCWSRPADGADGADGADAGADAGADGAAAGADGADAGTDGADAEADGARASAASA